MDPDDFLWVFDILNPYDMGYACIVIAGLSAVLMAGPLMLIHRRYLSGEARRKRCPNCRKRNAGELQSKEFLKQVTRTRMSHGGPRAVIKLTYRGTYTCKDCEHTWERTWKEEKMLR